MATVLLLDEMSSTSAWSVPGLQTEIFISIYKRLAYDKEVTSYDNTGLVEKDLCKMVVFLIVQLSLTRQLTELSSNMTEILVFNVKAYGRSSHSQVE